MKITASNFDVRTLGTRACQDLEAVFSSQAWVPQLVAQNIFLGQTDALNVVKRAEFQAKAREILKPLAPRLSVTTRVSSV
jgi:ABC-type sugar transport system ATPase subunit